MERPDHLPEELDKKTIKWLRDFGFTLNINDKNFERIKNNLKKWYPYEYYFYVDEYIRDEARKKFDSLKVEDFENIGKYYKAEKTVLRNEKKRLIKELYGLEKKGIL